MKENHKIEWYESPCLEMLEAERFICDSSKEDSIWDKDIVLVETIETF